MQFGKYFLKVIFIAGPFWLCSLAWANSAQLELPDFTMASATDSYAQRLSEQIGNPVMLLILARCDRCEDKLLDFQYLANSYLADDLVTWVVWTPYKKNQPPKLHIPVLNSSLTSTTNWQVRSKTNALLLINREGGLDHQLNGSLKKIIKQAEPLVSQWISSQARPEGL